MQIRSTYPDPNGFNEAKPEHLLACPNPLNRLLNLLFSVSVVSATTERYMRNFMVNKQALTRHLFRAGFYCTKLAKSTDINLAFPPIE